MDEGDKCFHHEINDRLIKEKGMILGGCVINWEIQCAGTPDTVQLPYVCKHYVPMRNIDKINDIN